MTQPARRPNDESEFGGAPGLVQPPPHDLTPAEELTLIKMADPSDPEDSAEAVRARKYRVE